MNVVNIKHHLFYMTKLDVNYKEIWYTKTKFSKNRYFRWFLKAEIQPNVFDGFPFQKVAIFSELEHSFLQLKSRNILFLFKNPELFVVSSSQSRQILVKSQLKVYTGSVAYFLIAKLDIKCFFPICHWFKKSKEIRLFKGNATDVAFWYSIVYWYR